MLRPLQQLLAVFILLAAIAWWVTGRVAVSHAVREFFLGEQESATLPDPSAEEQEKFFMNRVQAELPPPPAEHSPEVASLLNRLKELQNIPPILTNALKRDQETPSDQTPVAWNEAEYAALESYQKEFREAWEPFLSGPSPVWCNFPDSALLFRSHLSPAWHGKTADGTDVIELAFYRAAEPESLSNDPNDHPEFFLRFFRQTTTLGTLRYGNLSTWGITDTIALTSMAENALASFGYCFPPREESPDTFLSYAPPIPTVATLREGLKTDRSILLRAATYLDSLPAQTPASMALARLLGDKGDADWFAGHMGNPKTAHDLAVSLKEGAEQIRLLEQRTYLSGPAWRQWATGNPESGLCPVLRGSLDGMKEFETTQMEYQVALAFLKASVAYKKSGLEGMRNIPDPARPESFLFVTNSTSGITLSSAFQSKEGGNYSFTFETTAAP
ncbi:hypothetical protein EBX31_02405 [bacterium]|nr:hypothetical protein [bacterium]